MEVMFERVAGLDVGKDSVTVCLRTPGASAVGESQTRTFKTMFGSLRVMRDWLVENGVEIAAMESTSTYWKGPFYCLEEVMDGVAAERRPHEGRPRPQIATSATRSGLRSCWSTACWRRRSCHRLTSAGCGC